MLFMSVPREPILPQVIICPLYQTTKCMSTAEMHSLGPAARPGPKFRPGRAFCGIRTKGAGLMPGSGQAITVLCTGLRAMLERCWPGSMLASADFMRCRSGLGLGFWRNFCVSRAQIHFSACKPHCLCALMIHVFIPQLRNMRFFPHVARPK